MSALLLNPSWIFATVILMLAVFALVIRRHKTVLMGFAVITGLQLIIQNLSLFIVSYVFHLNDSWMTQSHFLVYAYMPWGMMAYALGMWLAWRPIRKNVPMSNPFLVEPVLIPIFLTVGTVIILAAGLMPNIPTVTGVLFRLAQFLQIGLLGATIYGIATRKALPIIISFLIFVPVGLYNMLASGQAWLLGPFLLHPVLLVLFWRRASWWRFAAFAAWLYVFFVMGGIWLNVRTLIRSDQLTGSFLTRAEQFIPEVGKLVIDPYSYSPQAVEDAAGGRLDLSVFLAAEANWMPLGEPYSYGVSLFIDPLSALVPRLLWPGKTLVLGDNDFINRFSGLNFEQGRISVDTNIVFEFYANFAIPGVIIGLFVFGYVLARIELAIFKPGQSLSIIMMSFSTLFVCSLGGRRAAFLVMEVVASVVSAWLLSIPLSHLTRPRKIPRIPLKLPFQPTALALRGGPLDN